MTLKAFNGRNRTALAGFKSRWNESEWMQSQKGYVQRACLAAASQQTHGVSFCQCGLAYRDKLNKHRFQTCGQKDRCPSCNYHGRVEPCQREYLPAFPKAPFWYALSAGWQSNPLRAGLHWVTKQDANGKALAKKPWHPFADNPKAPHTLRYGADSHSEMQIMAELPLKFADRLDKLGWFDGLYCVFEWQFAFYPAPGGGCFHTALPHLHFFGNRQKPLKFEDGKEIQRLYQRACLKYLGEEKLPAYPDLEIAPITSQERLKGWINYEVKAMPLEEFYAEGVRQECSITALNLEFHQTVWDCIKLIRSPRKFGNLFALKPGYIGVQQYRLLTKCRFQELTDKVNSGQALTEKEARQLEYHGLAVGQQKRYRLEKKRRLELAKQKRADSECSGTAAAEEHEGESPDDDFPD
jgi:hypothetical protein